jgi:predicted nucleic-acid-binding Zn-ribbon protein
MKVSGKCPKCGSTDIKENMMGGMGNMMSGRYYRCGSCGFTEIWQSKSDIKAVYGLYLLILILALGIGAYMYFSA